MKIKIVKCLTDNYSYIIFDERTLAVYKEKFKLKEKNISYDDFVKLASEKK